MIILMGVLGAGKSVQGELLAKNGEFEWLSTGSFIREHATAEQRDKMLKGELLQDEDLYKILSDYLESMVDTRKLVLDGFPRTLNQAKWLKKQHQEGRFKVDLVIFLELPKEVAKKRLMARGRVDDKAEVIERRISDFEKQTFPIVSWIKEADIRLEEVDANQTPERVQEDIREAISKSI